VYYVAKSTYFVDLEWQPLRLRHWQIH